MRKTIEEGINLEPTSQTGDKNGDLWVDVIDNNLKFYSNGVKPLATLTPSSIPETEFAFLNNQTAPADVTGLSFGTEVKYFKAPIFINRGADGESVELVGVNSSTGWQLTVNTQLGDDTGVDFSITAGGQIQYISTNTVGGVLVYKAQTIEYTP